MFAFFRRKPKLKPAKERLIYGVALLLGLSGSLVTYTASGYFSEAFATDNVGLIYAILHTVNLLGLFFLHHVVSLLGRAGTLFALLGIIIASVFGLSVAGISMASSVFLMLFLAVLSLLWVVMDILLEGFSVDSHSGRIRGTFLVNMNAGLLLGPILSASLIGSSGYAGLYFAVLLSFIFLLAVAVAAFHDVDYAQKVRRKNFSRVFFELSKRPDLTRIYAVSFVLDFFFAITVVYAPIHLLGLGLSWPDIGLIITVALVPFVLLQYPVGSLADRKIGEKELIIAALFIMAISLSFFPRVDTASVFAWIVLMVSARIGAALLEVLRDSYFYKRVDGNDTDVIDFFRTSRPAAYISSSILAAVFLLFFPVSQIFWLAFAVAVIGLYPAIRLKDSEAYG